jgi:hypothetical protein
MKFFHYLIHVCQREGLKDTLEQLQKIHGCILIETRKLNMVSKVFITLCIEHVISLDDANLISSYKWISLLLLNKPSALNRQAYAEYLASTSAAIAENSVNAASIALGISNVEDVDEIEWILQHQRPLRMRVVHLGAVRLPNLRTRAADLVHSWGLDSMLGLCATSDELRALREDAVLRGLGAAYDLCEEVLLAKSLLQLGNIVGVPFPLPLSLLEASKVLTPLSRLVHPFVHRKEFVSACRVVSLAVKEEDVGRLVELSERREAEEYDGRWRDHVEGLAAAQELSF